MGDFQKKTCFFGCSVQKGSFIIGCFCIVISTLKVFAVAKTYKFSFEDDNMLFFTSNAILKLALQLIEAMFDVFLIVGSKYRLQRFVLGWIVCTIIRIGGNAILLVEYLDIFYTSGSAATFGLPATTVMIALEVLAIYCIVVACRFYWELVFEEYDKVRKQEVEMASESSIAYTRMESNTTEEV